MADSDWMDVATAIKNILTAAIGATAGPAYQAALADPPATAHTIAITSFYVRKAPWDRKVEHPACVIVPVPEQLKQTTNSRDDWRHGFQVFITKASNRDLESDFDRLHFLRELAIGQFLSQRIAALSAYYCEVQPQAIIDDRAFANNYDSTSFVIWATKRKIRPTQASP